MRVEDVAEDTCGGRCDACGKKVKKRHHSLTLIDEQTEVIVGHYHAAPEFGCLSAASKYTGSPGPDMITSWVHPERCGRKLRKCDLGSGDVKKK